VNPRHLYEGTPQTNVDDMWARQRAKTALGKPRPDVTARHRRHIEERSGLRLADSDDFRWWVERDREAAQAEVAALVASVNRGDVLSPWAHALTFEVGDRVEREWGDAA
jgi:hypothetical protein